VVDLKLLFQLSVPALVSERGNFGLSPGLSVERGFCARALVSLIMQILRLGRGIALMLDMGER
jgi:hypothetical protein